MQVETGAAPGSAPRGVSRLGSVPFLAIPQTNLGAATQELWSAADQKRADKRDRLRDDENRVQNVVDGMGPSATERIQQVRTERADAQTGAEKKAFAKDLAQEQSTLRNNSASQSGNQKAGSQPNLAATPDDARALPSKSGTVASTGMNADSDPVNVGSNEPSSSAIYKPSAGNAEAAQPDKNARPPQQLPMPAPINASLNVQLRGGATPPVQPNPAITPQTSGELGSGQSQTAAPASAASVAQSKTTAPTAVDNAQSDRSTNLRTPRQSSSTPDAQARADESDADQRAENVQRMLRVLRGSLMRDKSSTVIRLDPPELGSLRLEMNLRKDAMDLRVGAESDAAREMLKDELETLRNGLQAAGIRLDRVEVYSLAAPVQVERHDSRTLERQTGGEPRDAAQRRATPREAAQRPATREADWLPDRPHGPAVVRGRVNVVA